MFLDLFTQQLPNEWAKRTSDHTHTHKHNILIQCEYGKTVDKSKKWWKKNKKKIKYQLSFPQSNLAEISYPLPLLFIQYTFASRITFAHGYVVLVTVSRVHFTEHTIHLTYHSHYRIYGGERAHTQAGWISQAHTAILPELDMAYMQWYWDTTTNSTLWYNNIFNENFPFKICLISTGAMKGGGFAVAGNTYKWHEANETNGATRVRRTQNEQRNQRMASATRIEFHHGIE